MRLIVIGERLCKRVLLMKGGGASFRGLQRKPVGLMRLKLLKKLPPTPSPEQTFPVLLWMEGRKEEVCGATGGRGSSSCRNESQEGYCRQQTCLHP